MKQFFFILLFLGLSIIASGQDKYITLKQEKIATIPKDYHISGVIDDRNDKSILGHITYSNGNQGNLSGGDVATLFQSFIEKNVSQDMTTKPVFLHITELNAQVSQRGSQWDITIMSTITFYASGYKLVEYSGKVNAQTSNAPETFVEGGIRKMIDKDLQGFNAWWPENKDQISTSPDVLINVSVSKVSNKPNAIIYSLAQPLQISDFMGPEQATGNEMAMTSSGIFMNTTEHIEKGQTVVDVVISPYFDKTTSWFKEEGKTPGILAHEQAHFDITAIKACELADTIKATIFTKENYMQLLEKLRAENAAASHEEEETYDTETNHSIIKDKQLEWQNKLTQQVKTIGCY